MKRKFALYIHAAGTDADMLRWPADDARNAGNRIGGLYGFKTAKEREDVKKAAEVVLGDVKCILVKKQFHFGIAHVNAAVKANSYEVRRGVQIDA